MKNTRSFVEYISKNNDPAPLDSPYCISEKPHCRRISVLVRDFSFFTQAFTSGQSHYREAPFSFASATIFFLSLAARGPSFHSSPVCWWPRWPRRGPEMNITFAAIRPSFALRLAPSLTRGPLAFHLLLLLLFLVPRPRIFFWFFLGATERNVPGKIRI